MWPFFNTLVLGITLWLLAGIVLILHRVSSKVSLTPLLVYLGGLTAAMQINTLGVLKITWGSGAVNLDSILIFPIVLFGLLVIYVVNGTVRAQMALVGVVFMTIAAALFRVLLSLYDSLPEFVLIDATSAVYSLQTFAASLAALGFDVVVLIMSYQAISNLRGRFPSRLAAGVSILLALSCDTFIFTSISHIGSPQIWQILLTNWVAKLAAGLALWPLLVVYFTRGALRIPDNFAGTPRSVMDLFTSTLQFESRAIYHFNLYRTLRQINQLISRSADSVQLLQQAAQMLVETRHYRVVWVVLSHEDQPASMRLVTQAGTDLKIQQTIGEQWGKFPLAILAETGQALVSPNLHEIPGEQEVWQQVLLEQQCQALLALPLRNAGKVLGVLSVGLAQAHAVDEREIELLQDLADDLAYGLVSLKARQQQAMLEMAIERMNDGLIIADSKGDLIYINPVVARISDILVGALPGKNVRDLLKPDQSQLLLELVQQSLDKVGISVEFPYRSAEGRELVVSVNASLVRNLMGAPEYWVANIRDVTGYRDYERQLLALNRLTADLVQIHDSQTLMERILQISEELLQANASGIYLIDPETLLINHTLTHNLPAEYSQRISRSYQGLPGEKAGQSLQPVSVTDTLNDPEFGERIHFMSEYGIRSLLVLPIVMVNQPLGALTVYYQHPHHLSEGEKRLGQTLSRTLSIIIQNAQLYKAEQSQRKLAEALFNAAVALNSSLELDDVLDQILEQVIRLLPGKAANVMLIDRDRACVARHQGYQQRINDVDELNNWSLSLDTPNLHKIISEKSILYIENTLDSEYWQIIAGSEWIRSYVGVPLKVGQQTVGFLNVDSDRPQDFNPETLKHLHVFAEHASIAIQNARLFDESRRRAEEMAALVAAASAVSRSLDFRRVIELVTEQMTKTLKVQACVISSFDPDLNQVELLVEYGTAELERAPEWYQPYDLNFYPVTLRVLEKNTPVQLSIDDVDLDPAEKSFMEKGGFRTLLMLPLMTQDRTIGLVELMDNRSDRTFTVREIALGYTLAAHAATAVENARLYQRLQDYAADLENRVLMRTAELQAAKENIEAILASVPDAVFVLDQHRDLIQANQAGQQLYEQAILSDLDLFSHDFLNMLEVSALPSEKAILEVNERFYQALSSILTAEETHFIGQVLVFRDVTRFREIDRMKTQFVSDVSHELRTPLTNLSLYLGLMTAVKDPAKQAEYLATLLRETDRLTHLIEDLLTISRLEAGKFVVNPHPVRVNALMEDLVRDRITLAAQKSIDLTSVLNQNDPIALADANLLVQAVSNLLTNAINYTDPGGEVTIYTDLCVFGEQLWVTVSVIDTGVGIDLEDQTYVFDRFFRGSASRKTGASGTGLGLAISREIVNRLEGEITVESTPGKGSAFTIWLKPDQGQTV